MKEHAPVRLHVVAPDQDAEQRCVQVEIEDDVVGKVVGTNTRVLLGRGRIVLVEERTYEIGKQEW